MNIAPALVALALATGACATPPSTPGDPRGGGPSSEGTGAASSTPGAPPVSSPRAGGTTSPPAASFSGRGGFPSAGPAKRNNMALEVTLNRTCARSGDQMVADAVTEAGAQITFAAGYSGDNSLVPDFHYVPKEGNTNGRITWRWVIRPEIPPGDAILSVAASKGDRGGAYNVPFRIAESC